MSKEKISSQEIVDLVAAKALVSKRAADEFLKVMILTIEEALLAGDVVKIKNFGTFKLHWNEPRKSVNVQTGEDIILSGYYKVSFTPDAQLRDLVNEPFAHLEAVQLDGESVEHSIPAEAVIDPLRTFNEQASEIKNILEEIKGLSSKPVVSELQDVEKAEIETEYEKFEDELPTQTHEILSVVVETEQKEEHVDVVQPVQQADTNIVEESNSTDREYIQSTTETIPEIESEAISPLEISEKKKHKVWLWILIISVLLGGSGLGLCCFYPPLKDSVYKMTQNVSLADMLNTFSGWFTPKPKKVDMTETVVIPKDTTAMETISENIVAVDSLQVLFDNPRVFTEYLGTERIQDGSRLTKMSKRYYGSKDFWVYIYEANRDNISDPDHISVGTIIKIPKLDARLIDVSNERCLQKAKELHDIYVK
ncbi:MAG: HU family DNA-binding protein [Paludibacter sp.]